ncbi:MAG: glycosyltransferase family 4 protein [Geminocystis sp.]|nr:glycosyltransferase family 4 protein [Geminocystis sp.]HIK37533.1 glycosyltransferase family 4 protein [Geminocystis sp. M7585_C2015_104]
MRILVLSWEFPPRIVGGIARHVSELYPEIVKLGDQVHLITVKPDGVTAAAEEEVEGIRVYRVSVNPNDNFFSWVAQMNQSMLAAAEELIRNTGSFDIIHAHDWLVADSAITLKHRYKIPLIATIHATEYGRHNGIHNQTQAYVASKEGSLVYEAWRVIVCSEYMRWEVNRALGCPRDKIDVIYNGIRPEKKQHPPDFNKVEFRRRFAQEHEKIIYYVGRMTYEKGIHVLLKAAGKVLQELHGNAKFVIIGGGDTSFYKQLAHSLGIAHHCLFTGFMSEEDLHRFTTVADCAVFPSLYEPFGIVVLESFASRVPVVVSDAGGLPEVVRHTQTGIVTQANNPHSLAWGILEVLKNPEYARYMVENAYKDLAVRFHWPSLARQTQNTYQLVVSQRKATSWL